MKSNSGSANYEAKLEFKLDALQEAKRLLSDFGQELAGVMNGSASGFSESMENFIASLKSAGVEVNDLVMRLQSSPEGMERLIDEIGRLRSNLVAAENETERLQERLDIAESSSGIDMYRERVNELQNTINTFTNTGLKEFESYLRSISVDLENMQGHWRFDEIYESIESGAITSSEAISKFKAEFSEFLPVGASNIDVSELFSMSEKIEELQTDIGGVISMLQEMNENGVKMSGGFSGIEEGAARSSTAIDGLIEKIKELGEDTGKSYASITELVTGLSNLATNTNGDGLAMLESTMRSIAKIGAERFSSIGKLGDGLRNIADAAKNNFASLSNLDKLKFENLKSLKVSKSSVDNTIRLVTEAGSKGVSGLKKLSEIDWTKLNSLHVDKSSVDSLVSISQITDRLNDLQDKINKFETAVNGDVTGKIDTSASQSAVERISETEKYTAALGALASQTTRTSGATDELISVTTTYKDALSGTQTVIKQVAKEEDDGAVHLSEAYRDTTVNIEKTTNAARKLADQTLSVIANQKKMLESTPGGTLQESYSSLVEAESKLLEIKKSLSTMDSDLTPKSFSTYNEELNKISEAVSKARTETEKYIDTQNKLTKAENQKYDSEKKYQSLLGQIEGTLKKYSVAESSPAYESYDRLRNNADELKTLHKEYESGIITQEKYNTEIKRISASTVEATRSIKAMGEDTQTAGNKLSNIAKIFSSVFSITKVSSYVSRAMKQMLDSSIEIDSAMTQLQIVTGATNSQMKEFNSTAVEMAKSLGKSVTEVTKSIETFSRLGYSLKDASELSKYATILANVASVDINESTTGLTSIIKGYGMEISETEHVADVLIEVGQKYAVSASEMMDAYERSGAALSATGVSFEKSAGLIAAANASIQNANTVGTALKTVSARIRGSKSELEELGEDTEELAEGFSKYRDELKQLTGFDIMIDDKSFKDLYDILDGISSVWGNLTDTQQARTAEILGGTRQLQVISSIINNWSDAAGAYDSAMNSAGVAIKSNARYMESTQAHLDQFKATLQELGADLFDSALVKGVVDFGKYTLQIIDWITDLLNKFGAIRLIIGDVFAITAIKKFAPLIDKIKTALLGVVPIFKQVFEVAAVEGVGKAAAVFEYFKSSVMSISPAGKVIIAITAAIAALTFAINKYKESHPSFDELKDSAQDTKDEIEDLSEKLKKNTDRIEELIALKDSGSFSFIQQEELDKLDAENEKLERNIALKQEALNITNNDLRNKAKAAARDYNEDTSHFEPGKYIKSFFDEYSGVTFKNGQEELSFMEERYSQLKSGEAHLNEQLDQAISDYNNAVEDKDEKEADRLLKLQRSLSASIESNSSELETVNKFLTDQRSTFVEYRDALDPDKDVDEYDFFSNAIEEIDKVVLGKAYYYEQANEKVLNLSKEAKSRIEELAASGNLNKESLMELASESDEINNTIDELKSYGFTIDDIVSNFISGKSIKESVLENNKYIQKSAKETVDTIKEELNALNAAISEQTESGSVSLDTYNELIKKSSDYSYCLEIEGNSIRINTEEAQKLYDQNKQIAKSQAEYNKALLKAKYAENAKEIRALQRSEKDLTDAQEDQLKSLLNEQSSIADNIIQYQLLITELNNAEKAYNKFKDAMNAANSGDNYEDFRGLQEQFQDWIDAGQTGVGNLQFKAYLDFVMPEGAEYDIKKYKEQVIDKLFTEDNEGSRKFMQALIEQGFAEGTIEEAVFKSGVAWQDLVDKITIDGQHISEGVAELMFDQLSMYEKFNFDWREFYGIEEAQDASVIQIANIEEAQAKLSALREEYKKLKADPETAEEAANIQAKMKEYQDYIETVMPTVNIEQELTTVDEKLGSIIDQLSGEKPTIGDLGAPDAISKLGELESLITKIQGDLKGGWLESANSLIATFNTAKEAEEESVDVTRGMPGMYGRTYGSISNKASIRGEGIGGSPVGDPESLAGRFSDAAEDINVDVNSIISDIEELKDELLSLGEEYNSLINGNLDYNKRPILSAKDLIDAGWDVAKEDMESIFTTYSSGFDHVGNFSISITPILEDGSVLSPQALEDYVSNLVGDSGLEQLLESDKYHLIIGVDENPEWNDEYWASFENSINSVKQEHAALVNDILLEQGIINQGGEFTITTNADETVKKLDEVASYKIKDKSFTIKAFVQSIGDTVNSLTSKVKNALGGASAAGTPNAKGGKTLVNELGPELISENGRAYIANGGNPAVIDLSPGAIVLDADTTKKALAYQTIGKKIGAYASGTNSKKCLNCGKAIAINTVTCPYCGAPQNTTAYLAWKKAQTPVKTTSSNTTSTGGVPTGGGSSSSSGGGSGGGGGSSGSSSKDKEESWFEKQYKEHQHLLEMDQESVANYLVWLNDAYQRAYKEGIIELDDFYKYAEEIYKGLHDHFIDYLNDNEFTIEMLNNQEDASGKVADIYRQLLNDVRVQIDNAYAQGLRDTDDYVQELWQKWWSYHDDLEDLRETTESDAKDAVDSLVQYRIKMIEKELEDEKKSYDDRLNNLKEFIDKQKQMLRNSADEEDYLKEQADKRKKISDLEAQLAQLEFDDSAWAQKKKLELQEELTTAREDLQTFERDHAIEMTETELDSIYELAEEASNRQTDLLQKQLDNASVLYQKALDDVRNNSQELYDEMVAYELSQGSGVADAIKEMWEEAYIALDKYKGLYGEFYRGVELQNLTGYTQEVINTSLPSGARSGYVSPFQGTYTPSTSVSTSSTPAAAPPSLAVGSYVDIKSGAKWYGNSYGGDGSGSARGGTIKYTNPGSPYPYNIDGAGWVRKEDIVGYAHGTSNATKGLHAFDEDGSEYIFTSSDGNKYKLFNSGDKVLNSKASQFLYDFANKGSSIIGNFAKGLNNFFGNIGSMSPIQVNMGDIIVSGNANELTVSEIRRAQRENVDYMLKEFRRLKA